MRGKVSKIAMFMLVLCMTISMFAVNVSAADETTAIDSCTRVVEAYDLDDAQDYIDDGDTSTYPTKDGYVFAGWYTDEACGKDSYWGEQEPGGYGLCIICTFTRIKCESANFWELG